MSKGKIIAAVAVVFGAYFFATPYITVHQMKSAAEDRDGEALAEYIDFPSVRQSLKDQMNAMVMGELSNDEMKDNPMSALGAAFAGVMVDKMVESFVTPAGITKLMAGEKPAGDEPAQTEETASTEAPASKPFSDVSMSYESFSKFVVKAKGDADDSGKFVFRRDGLGWKMTDIIVPLNK